MTTKAEWHLIDAKDKVLGRLATRVATLLQGKHRTDYAANRVALVFVVITNSDLVVLTGRKEVQKKYRRHSGYPGGLREKTAGAVRAQNSRRLVQEAVLGMLPKNSLRQLRIRHLKIYPTAEHPHLAQLATKL